MKDDFSLLTFGGDLSVLATVVRTGHREVKDYLEGISGGPISADELQAFIEHCAIPKFVRSALITSDSDDDWQGLEFAFGVGQLIKNLIDASVVDYDQLLSEEEVTNAS